MHMFKNIVSFWMIFYSLHKNLKNWKHFETNFAPWTDIPTCNNWAFFVFAQNCSNRLIFCCTMWIIQKVKSITWYTHYTSWFNTPSTRRCTWTIVGMVPITSVLFYSFTGLSRNSGNTLIISNEGNWIQLIQLFFLKRLIVK